MAVTAVALLIANGLFVESVRIFSASGRELREPGSELALRLLRSDVQSAAAVGSSLTWSYLPLDCWGNEAHQRWELEGDQLQRRRIGLDGSDLGARRMLDRVLTFRWRSLAPGLVEVEIVRRKPPGASAIRASTPVWKSVGDALESSTVVVGSRIAGGA